MGPGSDVYNVGVEAASIVVGIEQFRKSPATDFIQSLEAIQSKHSVALCT